MYSRSHVGLVLWLALFAGALTGCDSKPPSTSGDTAEPVITDKDSSDVAGGQLEIAPVAKADSEEVLASAEQAKPATKEDEKKPKDADDDGLPDDLHVFDIPEGGDNDALLQFMVEIPGRILTSADEEKVGLAITTAAERVLKNNPTEAQRRQATELLFEWLQRLHDLYTREADEVQLYWKMRLAEYEETDDPKLAQVVAPYRLLNQAIGWKSLRLDQQQAFMEQLPDYFANRPLDDQDLETAMKVAGAVLKSGDQPAAVQMYRALADILEKSSEKSTAGEARRMRGIAHRLESLGQEVSISATKLGGEQLDWSAYQGKVVLVDFWATWCPPCVAEMPNIQKLYDIYHERGFDVIGVSADQDEQALKDYVTEHKIPWAVTFSYLEDAPGLRQPLAVDWGVMTLPVTMLIDQEGKLIALNVHGDELAEWLENLLGPADVASATAEIPEGEKPAAEPTATPPASEEKPPEASPEKKESAE